MLGEAFVHAVLDSTDSLIFVKDRESRVVYANDAFLALYSPEERKNVIGATTVENFAEDEAALFLEEDRKAFARGQSEIVEEITDWEGEKRILSTRKTVYTTEDGGELLLAIAKDITALKNREHALTRANRQLREYAHSVAHDLRSPIAAIISGVSIIERDKNSSLSERATLVSKAVKESAHGLSKHLTAMLEAAKSDQLGLSFKETDLNLLLEEVRFNLSALSISREAKIHSPRLPVVVVEPTLFRQMLQSLIENAIRHAGVEKPVVKIGVQRDGGEYEISFCDKGPGIPTEKRHLAMKPFSKPEDGHVGEGYGLGLMQCQRIAQLHEGFLEIPNEKTAPDDPTIVARISAELQAR
ncbi:PAS domain-containing sensor histidine kinase [Aurantiacibacter sp. MUD61]|uniref:PAS domain-containing sensor histidine kinase n=1 Tax=Aurantiacibacter sp. MUD61 TaxID=3009083 RepID=UPI0022F06461|nr:PAS domain-containing sensor histidine kinase [Aurantiacibacter sp. MUD61]